MIRRSFIGLIAAVLLAPACALKTSSRKPLATIGGHVFGRGLRFGRSTELNPPGTYRTTFTQPGVPVTLTRIIEAHEKLYSTHEGIVVAKTFTDNQGYFLFKDVPGGYYAVMPLGGEAKMIYVHRDQYYHAGLFQR